MTSNVDLKYDAVREIVVDVIENAGWTSKFTEQDIDNYMDELIRESRISLISECKDEEDRDVILRCIWRDLYRSLEDLDDMDEVEGAISIAKMMRGE